MAVIFRNSKTVFFFVNLKKKKTLHKEGKTRGKRSCSKRKKAFQVSFFSLVINDEYYPWIKLTLSVCMSEGLFTCLQDPRRWNNFTMGLHAEISVRVVPKYRRFEKELKMALTTIFQQNYQNNQLVVTPSEMVGLYCRD